MVRRIIVIGLLALLGFSTAAFTDTFDLPITITVQVNSAAGEGSLTYEMPFTWQDLRNADPQQLYSWYMENPVQVMDDTTGTVCLADINGINMGMRYDPIVDLGFSVQAGAADTTFTIKTSWLYFESLNLVNPQAWATSNVGLPSDSNGATITGNVNGHMYRAMYEDAAYTRLTFDDELPGALTAPPFTPTTMIDGTYGLWTIPGSVVGMGSMFHFTLSAYDQANGGSHFEIIPEPATTALLVLGGLALIMKKRK
ncbi:MAG: PEP-CTERM sorting domain-containing protein [Planctomycetes bacterium]|nr:PEP-CTERM sorting domain-containing protein [Planctomycetota bacterium]